LQDDDRILKFVNTPLEIPQRGSRLQRLGCETIYLFQVFEAILDFLAAHGLPPSKNYRRVLGSDLQPAISLV
jgi:hypothetical protein